MTNKKWDALWINGSLATMEPGSTPYGLIKEAALAIDGGKIVWVGPMQNLPGIPGELAIEVQDVEHQCLTPALIDCHTHIVYAGNRANEFEMRLNGKSYIEIAEAGGGIRATVAATRAASIKTLLAQSYRRAKALCAEGVMTMEIKSGYGLDLQTELKMLEAAKRLSDLLPLTVVTTFLGAHTVPPEFQHQPDHYVDLLCQEMIPAVAEAKLADAVDVFCEKIAFNLQQTERIFQAAQKAGLRIKCHAEQLSNLGASFLAAQYHALSVDHLEFLKEQDVVALAKSGTVAVLLPGALYYLREKHLPPIQLLRQYQVPMAVATDCNPGTSPITSLLLMLNMACTLMQLTPEEALAGVTRVAAKALGLETTRGTLTVGKEADFVVWDIQHPVELVYQIGLNPVVSRIKSGIKLPPL